MRKDIRKCLCPLGSEFFNNYAKHKVGEIKHKNGTLAVQMGILVMAGFFGSNEHAFFK